MTVRQSLLGAGLSAAHLGYQITKNLNGAGRAAVRPLAAIGSYSVKSLKNARSGMAQVIKGGVASFLSPTGEGRRRIRERVESFKTAAGDLKRKAGAVGTNLEGAVHRLRERAPRGAFPALRKVATRSMKPSALPPNARHVNLTGLPPADIVKVGEMPQGFFRDLGSVRLRSQSPERESVYVLPVADVVRWMLVASASPRGI